MLLLNKVIYASGHVDGIYPIVLGLLPFCLIQQIFYLNVIIFVLEDIFILVDQITWQAQKSFSCIVIWNTNLISSCLHANNQWKKKLKYSIVLLDKHPHPRSYL